MTTTMHARTTSPDQLPSDARRWTEGTFHHWPWCDRNQHAAYAQRTGWDDLCAGRKMTEPYEGEQHWDGSPVEVRGQWRASHRIDYPGHPRFEVEPIGELTDYGVRVLRDYLTGVDNPRAVALRALLTRALTEIETAPAVDPS